MFSNTSNLVQGVDTAFVAILAIIIFFLVGLTIALLYFIYRYHEKRNPKATQIEGNNKLEITWTVVPLFLVMAMFYFGWTGWKPLYSKAPKEAMNIKVTSRMWSWNFQYPNGKNYDTLVIPRGKAINLELNSPDVLHSIYIPAFRLKQDIVPGRKINRWFVGNTPGKYDLFCAEYCGLQHSYMYTSVKVLPFEEFEKWYIDTSSVDDGGGEITPAMLGARIAKRLGCNACHSTNGTKIVGPTFKGLFGSEVVIVRNGKNVKVEVDEEYIIRSINKPSEEIVKGYDKLPMQSYEGQINNEEMDNLIEYIKSIK